MSVTLPSIEVIFRQLAASFVSRSERGIAALILRDATEGSGESFFRFGDATQVPEDEFTAANQQYIKDALSFGPLRVSVVKVGSSGTLADALAILVQKEQTGWITVCGGTTQDWSDLSSWIKAREKEQKSWKAVCYNTTAPDCMHIVNLVNPKVTFGDERGEVEGSQYAPSLAGLLAACNVLRGATGYVCGNLAAVEEPEDVNAAVGAGKFVLVNEDDQVKVGVDIETVEAMDLMRDDITNTFRTDYRGKYKNTTANQMLFLAAINGYFRDLGDENVLDPTYDNTAGVDVTSQRNAWIDSGKAEAVDWDDGKVIATPYKRKVFLGGDVKILGSMTDLRFVVALM